MRTPHTPNDLEPTRTSRLSIHTTVVSNQESDFLIKDLTGLTTTSHGCTPDTAFTPSPATLTKRDALREIIGGDTLNPYTENAIGIQALLLTPAAHADYHTLSVTKLEPLSDFFDLPPIYSITATPLSLPLPSGVHYINNLTPYAHILNPRWVFSFNLIPFGDLEIPLHTLLALNLYLSDDTKDEQLNDWRPDYNAPSFHIHSHFTPPEIYPDHTTRPPINGVEWTNHTDKRFSTPTPPGVDFFIDASRATAPVLSTALLLTSDILITTKADDLLNYRKPSPWNV